MSLSNKNPDVEIPGLATGPPRGQLVRDAEACAREKNITTTGKASISVYVIAACGVAMVAAGANRAAAQSIGYLELMITVNADAVRNLGRSIPWTG